MDRKRELTSVDIAALVGELGAYEGAGFGKAYLYEDGLLRLKLRHYERGRVELLVDTGETKHARVASPDRVPPAPERPPNFAMMLRNRLAGAELAAVEQFEFDRILRLRFEREDDSTTVVAELFGDGNIAVLDGAGEVVDCLDTVRLKSRTVAPGAQYEYPDARFNPLSVDFEGFRARFEQSDTDVVQTIATQLNFGGTWAEELCTRAGVEKTLPIDEADDEVYRTLYSTVGDLAERLQAGDLDPRLYRDDDRVADVTPVPMAEYEAEDWAVEPFDRFTEALDEYFHALATEDEPGGEEAESGGRDRPDFEAEIEKQQRIIDQQEGAIENFEEEARAHRERAEALYANYDLVDELLTTVREARAEEVPWEEIEARFEEGREQGIPAAEAVRQVDGSEGTVTVAVGDHEATLRVKDGVEKNADRLYREAKEVEGKKEGAEEAVAETRAELERLRERREQWEAGEAGEAGDDGDGGDEEEEVDWLSRASIPVRSSEQWYEQFRWFHTSDGFLVIGGRDADDNEALVKKYLDAGDLFFHAQAHGGPATVLKTTGPSEPADPDIEVPDRSKEQAARFAVSYSSVWKDGRFAGDAYMVGPDQVSKTPESGEYLEKGGFAIRGERTYFRDVPVGVAVGITCEPETRVIGGPPEPVRERAETAVAVEPGRYAQNDIAKRLYREFRDRFADDAFVRKVASPDRIQEFLPPGGSRMVE
ncbi:ribosome rescue protein RqcH [Salinirussus salinus]|uniref:ribosome rescue protein RqcH n=1 Tax=Salinirussus salinus TaxID=1198300 RepID=UPI001359C1DD|nr:ribosome rescue protein RqcH [Salinirussus salinus]